MLISQDDNLNDLKFQTSGEKIITALIRQIQNTDKPLYFDSCASLV